MGVQSCVLKTDSNVIAR
jgi:ribonuclease HI